MKKITFLVVGVLLVIVFSCFCQAAEIIADSRIVKVIVYPDCARVSRLAQVKLNAGDNSIVFDSIVPVIDENSLRVSLLDTEAVWLKGVRQKIDYLVQPAPEKVQKLRQQIRSLEDQQRKEQDFRRLLNDEKNFLDSLRFFVQAQLPRDLITKVPTTAELDGIYKFLDSRLKEYYQAMMDSDLRTRLLNEQLDVLRRELSDIENPTQRLKRSIVVEVEAKKAQTAKVIVSYLVKGASWQPLYDARADFDKQQLEFICYAILRQTTGEPWSEVQLSISTAVPSRGGVMPDISSWIIRPRPPVEKSKSIALMGVSRSAQYAEFETDKIDRLDTENTLVQETAVLDKTTSLEYNLPQPVNVPCDGQEITLPIISRLLKAKFDYSSFPAKDNLAYVRATLTNIEDMHILPAKVNIFISDMFVGSSKVDAIAPKEEFNLYLGADEQVKIQRQLIEKRIEQTILGALPSPNKKTEFKFKITVQNLKKQKVTLKIFEALPVSEDDRIKVKITYMSQKPTQENWQDKKGVCLWEMELAPQEKKEITYSFNIEHPRDMQIEGL
ncbi:MAG: mucoidy inhibitor MuiA family protein [Candidatus Omnitrophica bacterium]|nr:mucoidy inhibitor MuiA family protein [Candidatus Omnitrophota bacterium]